jgi:ABC-type polysaccharide/polyol phosphate transport system ATPase subunit
MSEVKLESVSFEYPVFGAGSRSFRTALLAQRTRRKVGGSYGVGLVRALDDISLDLRPGDRLGLVGHNGAGKSTLLRVIAGIAAPSKGVVRTEGRIIPLISRGLGINADLTGRENIELPLRLFGATDEEVEEAKQTVSEFTELGEFLDMPVRIYSDGMRARLTFGICTALRGDILVLDEWLGAGDAGFVQKATERLKSMVEEAGIVVLASHSTSILKQNCNKIAWLENGRLREIGKPAEVLKTYAAAMQRADGRAAPRPKAPPAPTPPSAGEGGLHKAMEEAWARNDRAAAYAPAKQLFAINGNSQAAYWLGVMHVSGNGAKKDLDLGLAYLRTSGLENSPWALYYQGLVLADTSFHAHSSEAAAELFRRALKGGVKEAAADLTQVEKQTSMASGERTSHSDSGQSARSVDLPTSVPS